MSYKPYKLVGKINIMELKLLIKECLREFEDEKYRATNAGAEEQYKQLWIKPPTDSTGGLD